MIYNKDESAINNIAKLRKKKKLTINDLATISELSEHTIASFEKDRLDLRKCDLATIIKLCDALHCTPIVLFKGDYGEKLLRICRKKYKKLV